MQTSIGVLFSSPMLIQYMKLNFYMYRFMFLCISYTRWAIFSATFAVCPPLTDWCNAFVVHGLPKPICPSPLKQHGARAYFVDHSFAEILHVLLRECDWTISRYELRVHATEYTTITSVLLLRNIWHIFDRPIGHVERLLFLIYALRQ